MCVHTMLDEPRVGSNADTTWLVVDPAGVKSRCRAN